MYRTFNLIYLLSTITLTGCSINKSIDKVSENPAQIVEEKLIPDASPSSSPSFPHSPTPLAKKEPVKISSNHCHPTCPATYSTTHQLLNHDDFILSYNVRTKYADWVGYKLDKEKISGSGKKRTWRADPALPPELAMVPSDYKEASATCNYDRGHQAPLADFSNSKNWERVNYLSNITPQKASLNQGSWNNLEGKIRSLAKQSSGDIYVLTGTFYNGKPVCKLPYARIENIIPNGYWKIVTVVTNNNIYRASFKFDQETPKDANFCQYQIGIQELKKLITYPLNLDEGSSNSEELLKLLGCANS